MYSKVLQRIIAEANITQDELSKKCKDLNVPISRVQINKILNNKALAPTEEVSRAIAKACNVDDKELVLEGYLEKAPKEFIDFLNNFQKLCFELSICQLKNNIEPELMELLLEEYKKQTIVKIIIEVLNFSKDININNDIIQIKNSDNNSIFNFEKPCIVMEDNSMDNKIPKDSKLNLVIPEKYKNGDIILVEYNNIRYVRVAIFIGSDIFLYPLNKDYRSFYINKKDCNILAKIDSIEIKL